MLSPSLDLSPMRAAEILSIVGLSDPLSVELIKTHNHVWRIETGGGAYFLKTYTKNWYGDDIAGTAFCVEHEHRAWAILADHGMDVPHVMLDRRDIDNPLGRPFIITRQLGGEPLTKLLALADKDSFRHLLETTGDYLRRIHAITFEYPGYIAYDGPSTSPREGSWQHPIWSARGTQQEALAVLAAERSKISPDLARQLEGRFATMEQALAPAFSPPRFTHGDCHAHQFFLQPEDDGRRVTGVLDMEVASAGDCVADLLKLTIELMVELSASTRWWEPLFSGYGSAPDFDLFKLRLLGLHEINFTAHGADKWPDRETLLRSILAARDWTELFAIREEKPWTR